MTLQKLGGMAAITEAFTYIFGFVLFFGVLDSTGYEKPELYLEFIIQNRDYFFTGYLISGLLFSFVLIVLVQSIYQRFKSVSPELMRFTAIVGYIWACIVLSSSMIFLTSLSAVAKYHSLDPNQALAINRAVNIVVEALGGGIELVGAAWVLAISYTGIKGKIYSPVLHYWGFLVGISGVLTLFSGISFLSSNPFFEITTAIFGLGQILWFIFLGTAMLRELPVSAVYHSTKNSSSEA
ncbi:DUF4386 family protein [Microbulbifer sp. OS29]|uniref:DUF4386 family protein n=1 Tax=Microbulbifer okhotskensis TaxID=2926617 RepID=A0A9X2J5L9_9GAMM|nr:DUF4386 family protein [Microbulbifer okhotskensis]MCO1335682.1 DUF4386 family protein [Microbulbifer okhotskensis]